LEVRAAVRLIDALLRTSGGIYEFTDDPECILRIQLKRASLAVNIRSERIMKGEPVVALHVWNEPMPILPAAGADLEWALRLRRQAIHSFRGLAKVLQNESRYSQVKAVCGISALFSFTDHTGGMRMMRHLGFTILPYQRPLGRFGEFWENLFSWWLMWTYNKVSLQSREFLHLQRTEIWMTASKFIQRYGESVQ
jgi:hypothetical protein